MSSEYPYFEEPLSPHFSLLVKLQRFDKGPYSIHVDPLYRPGALSYYGSLEILELASKHLAVALQRGDAMLIASRGDSDHELAFNKLRRFEISRLRRTIEDFRTSITGLEAEAYALDDLIRPWIGAVSDDNLSPLLRYFARRTSLAEALEEVSLLLDLLPPESWGYDESADQLARLQVNLMMSEAAN